MRRSLSRGRLCSPMSKKGMGPSSNSPRSWQAEARVPSNWLVNAGLTCLSTRPLLGRMFFIFLWALLSVASQSPAFSVLELQAKVAAEPANLKAKFLLGKAYAASGEPRKSIEIYNEILRKKRAPSVMFQLALEYSKVDDLDAAIQLWLDILRDDGTQPIARPLSTLTMQHLAMALHKRASYEFSLTWWRRALEVDPSNEKARLFSGVELYKLTRYKEAAREWLILLKSRPSPESARKALYYLALDFVKLGQPARAIKVFERLLALVPGHPGAQKALAKLRSRETPPVPPASEVTKSEDEAAAAQHKVEPSTNPQYAVPPKQDAPIPALPGGVGPAEKMSLQAEELFFDGLDQKEKGNYEKALFSFLQALDVDPKFTQVYLQVGEVYLHLARLAPTKTQFRERLVLSVQSLEKVNVLAPNTLLAHSAQSKIVQAKKLESEGFGPFHLASANAAFKEGRTQDAFDQYILLLSSKVFDESIFLNLARMLPALNRGNKQDLQFFLEDLAAKNAMSPFIPYLLGRTYLAHGKSREAKITLDVFLDRISKVDLKDRALELFQAHATIPKGEPTDRYLLGAILFIKRSHGPARIALREYIDRSLSNAPFRNDALRKLGQLDAEGSAMSRGFEQERKELIAGVPRTEVLFGPYVERSHADERLLEEVRSFTQGRPDNGVARFALAWIMSVRAEKLVGQEATENQRQAEGLFVNLQKERGLDADWHFQLGALALSWGAEDRASTHLKISADILLVRGRPASSRHAGLSLETARQMMSRGRVSAAAMLLKQSHVYDPDCLSYYLTKYELDASQGKITSALWSLMEWVGHAFGNPWHRMLLLTNLGLVAIQVLLLTLIGVAAALILRYFETFHHFFLEYLSRKGIMLSIPLLLVIGLILVPTGFLVVFPLIAFATLSRIERQTYLAVVLLLLVVPLLLPVSFEGNFEFIRMAEELRAGNLETARPFFEQALKRNEHDYVARYLLGQIYLRERLLEPADKQFSKLYDQNPYDVGVLVNLAAVKARKDDTKKAMALLALALGRQAADLPALFNMMAIHSYLGQQEKASQYLKWASAAARETDQFIRYQSFSSPGSPQLVLMDHPLDPSHLAGLFSFFSTSNFFAFNSAVLKVIVWIVAGGGLLAWLIFVWQRLDFALVRCSVCLRMICDQCRHTGAKKSLCPECASLPRMDRDRHKDMSMSAAERLKSRTHTLAWIGNLILPGTGFFFADWAPVGAFLQALFLGLVVLWWQGGGTLLTTVYQPPDLPIVKVLLWFCLALAMGVYALAQAGFHQLRDEVRPV